MVPAPPHGLVLVYGPGPGLGKSTLGRALAERLAARGRPSRFFEEHEVSAHPAFRDYVRSVEAGRAGDVAALVEACRRFVAELEDRRPEISVLDSVLPCWDWLYNAGCPDDEVFVFSRTLAGLLSPLSPVLVYVEGDLDAALSRAIEERGTGWALDLAADRTGRRNPDALDGYFRRLRSCVDRVVSAAGTM